LRARARAQKSIKDVLRRVVGADVVDDKKDFISKEVDRIISSGIFPPFFFQRCSFFFFDNKDFISKKGGPHQLLWYSVYLLD
jgi:hypothetical protein